ncbi:MAG TPA: phosphatase PAP2 family protein [Xanthobacteraceae bacterium]|nr:phosphatase PAP2 family protein [Xanthobacteraceae bacterium]
MNRTGLLIALFIAVVVGFVFAIWPGLDLALSSPFYDTTIRRWRGFNEWLGMIRDAASWLIALVAAPAVVALVVKLLLPRRPSLLPGRAIVLMLSTLLIGPGLAVNVILKDNSGRPRPFYITEFGGDQPFHPWWDMRGECEKNCSFVAGEPSGAFWTMAGAAVTPPQWRAVAYGAALAFGAGVGVLRMAAGAHFFTDVVFAGVVVFLVIWLTHGLLYRWRATRLSDAAVERFLERVATPGYNAVIWIVARLRGSTPRS